MAALSIKARALRYLALREHSRAELERKLSRPVRGGPGVVGAGASDHDAAAPVEHPDPLEGAEARRAAIARVLDELTARGLLDEQRAADAVVAAQSRRFGQRRLQQTLRARGLGADEAAVALARIEGSELERARSVWQRRFGVPATDAAERARQARFLAGRGFAGDVIRRVVQGLDDDTG